jgi:hypothetical protein
LNLFWSIDFTAGGSQSSGLNSALSFKNFQGA